MADATSISEHPKWNQRREPPKLKPFQAKDRGGCDPDVAALNVTVSNTMELRRLAFLIAHEDGREALIELFHGIAAELAPQRG